MQDPADALEARMARLRRAIRQAKTAGDAERYNTLRAELKRSEAAWELLVDPDGPIPSVPDTVGLRGGARRVGSASLVPAREQVHRTLTLLGVPAAPKLVVSVHDAFFPDVLPAAKLTSLRRDEERSYRSAPNARPYYLCPALTYDLLSPARALLTVSTWPLERRVIGPLSPRMDFLTCAINLAEAALRLPAADAGGPPHPVSRLLWRFAANIPGAMPQATNTRTLVPPRPDAVIAAARAEARLHAEADLALRTGNARRARRQLSDLHQLFGAPSLRVVGADVTEA